MDPSAETRIEQAAEGWTMASRSGGSGANGGAPGPILTAIERLQRTVDSGFRRTRKQITRLERRTLMGLRARRSDHDRLEARVARVERILIVLQRR